MARVIVTKDIDYPVPGKPSHIAYKAGREYTVTTAIAQYIVDRGAGRHAYQGVDHVGSDDADRSVSDSSSLLPADRSDAVKGDQDSDTLSDNGESVSDIKDRTQGLGSFVKRHMGK